MREEALASLLRYAADRPRAHTLHVQVLGDDGLVKDIGEFGLDWGRARPENAVAWALAVPNGTRLHVCVVRPDGTHHEDGPGHETYDYQTFS